MDMRKAVDNDRDRWTDGGVDVGGIASEPCVRQHEHVQSKLPERLLFPSFGSLHARRVKKFELQRSTKVNSAQRRTSTKM